MFFIFMLFIISSNGTQKDILTNSGVSISGVTLSWETDQNLDDLIKRIDNQELVVEEETNEWEEELQISQEVTTTDVNSWEYEKGLISSEVVAKDVKDEKWFFARLFGKDDEEDRGEDKDTTQTWTTSTGTISWESNDNNDDTESTTQEIVTVSDTKDSETPKEATYVQVRNSKDTNSSSNMIKNSSWASKKTYVDPTIMYPGTDLETKIGNSYEIGVTTLKLNNKNFDTTLAYLHKGETVTQLTSENEYGCFQIEVGTTSQLGYVCKKYLTMPSQDQWTQIAENTQKGTVVKETNKVLVEQTRAIPAITTTVWSYYKIALDNTSFFDVILERFILDKWDVLKQVSNPDPATGCVSMKVVGTTTWKNDGKVVGICSPDMVTAL